MTLFHGNQMGNVTEEFSTSSAFENLRLDVVAVAVVDGVDCILALLHSPLDQDQLVLLS